MLFVISSTNASNGKDVHVSSIVPAPEVILELGAEHVWQRLVFRKSGLGPVTHFVLRGWCNGRFTQRGEGEVFGRLKTRVRRARIKERRQKETTLTQAGCRSLLSYAAVYALRTSRSGTGPARPVNDPRSPCSNRLADTHLGVRI